MERKCKIQDKMDVIQRVRRLARGFECLPDELLAEILYRCNCSKSVVQCKCVCTRWCNLVSQLDFLQEWDKRNVRSSFHVLFRMIPNMLADREAPMYNNLNFLFSILNQNLSLVLDDLGDTTRSCFKVVGACHDLVLCCRDNKIAKYFDFLIINVQTKQRIQLPSPSFYYSESIGFRFMCDPHPPWRYNVVVFHSSECRNTTEFPVHMLFSTNGNKWCDKVLSFPRPCSLYWAMIRVQAFQGKHVLGAYTGLLFVDPYQDDEMNKAIACPHIDWPPYFSHGPNCAGVHDGKLVLSFISYKDTRLWVCLLKDYKTSEWQALHSIAIQDLVCVDPRLEGRLFNKYTSIGSVLGIDPANTHVLYILNARDIILWDLRHKTMQLVCSIPEPRPDREFGGFWTFSLTFTSSPTLLPTLL